MTPVIANTSLLPSAFLSAGRWRYSLGRASREISPGLLTPGGDLRLASQRAVLAFVTATPRCVNMSH